MIVFRDQRNLRETNSSPPVEIGHIQTASINRSIVRERHLPQSDRWNASRCTDLPQILMGASNSNKIGWLRKISRLFKHRPRISFSVRFTCFPGLLPRTICGEKTATRNVFNEMNLLTNARWSSRRWSLSLPGYYPPFSCFPRTQLGRIMTFSCVNPTDGFGRLRNRHRFTVPSHNAGLEDETTTANRCLETHGWSWLKIIHANHLRTPKGVGFSLRKGRDRLLFTQFAWTHVILLVVVCQGTISFTMYLKALSGKSSEHFALIDGECEMCSHRFLFPIAWGYAMTWWRTSAVCCLAEPSWSCCHQRRPGKGLSAASSPPVSLAFLFVIGVRSWLPANASPDLGVSYEVWSSALPIQCPYARFRLSKSVLTVTA